MNLENFNDKLLEALAKSKHEEKKKVNTCIYQLINDITESDMKDCEKSAIVAGLMLLQREYEAQTLYYCEHRGEEE